MDLSGDMLATCGFALRHSTTVPDAFVQVHDLRTMRPLPALQVPAGAALLQFVSHPGTALAALSRYGLLVVSELRASGPALSRSSVSVASAGASIAAMAVSSSGQLAAFADTTGQVRLFANAGDPYAAAQLAVNWRSRPSVMAGDSASGVAALLPRAPALDFDLAPLSLVPLPVSRGRPALSEWNPVRGLSALQLAFPCTVQAADHAYVVRARSSARSRGHLRHRQRDTMIIRRPPVRIDEALLRQRRNRDFVGYLPNASGQRVHHVPYAKIDWTLRPAGASARSAADGAPDSTGRRGDRNDRGDDSVRSPSPFWQ